MHIEPEDLSYRLSMTTVVIENNVTCVCRKLVTVLHQVSVRGVPSFWNGSVSDSAIFQIPASLRVSEPPCPSELHLFRSHRATLLVAVYPRCSFLRHLAMCECGLAPSWLAEQ